MADIAVTSLLTEEQLALVKESGTSDDQALNKLGYKQEFKR